ncbi:MAG TPA: 3-ketoacyl-ACP reductase [Flavitalea sp.]|nr:3-ketoacyl-ACP reductase [Flavitalea sp.]
MNRVAFITGGSRGIGYGIAKELAKNKFDLAINGVRPANQVQNVIDELKVHDVDVIYCQGDISSADARQSMINDIKNHYGRLNILVNNAGVAPKERKDILEGSEESFLHVLTTNLQGPYFLTQTAANWMIEQKQKDDLFECCIVNISSISATVASVNRGEYCIAKAGLSMVTQLFATRLGEYNIPVYEVRPGIIHTDMTAGVTDKYDKLIDAGLTIQKRWGESDDVGKAVAALALRYFPYSTGQVIMVDGGMTVARL